MIEYSGGGYLGVEFFCVLSGYLLCEGIKKQKYSNVFSYLDKRIKQLLPYNLIMIFCWLVWNIYVYVIDMEPLGSELISFIEQKVLYAVVDAFFLQMFFPSQILNHAVWYISVLLIVSFFLYLLLSTCQKNVSIGIIAAITIFSLRFVNQTYGNLDVHFGETPIFKIAPGVIRGMGEMGAGIIGNYLISFIKIEKKKAVVCKILLLLGAFLIMFKFPHTYLDIVFVLFITFEISLEFVYPIKFSLCKDKYRSLCFGWMRKASVSIYFSHLLVIQVFIRYFSYAELSNKGVAMLFYMMFVTIFATFLHVIVQKCFSKRKISI